MSPEKPLDPALASSPQRLQALRPKPKITAGLIVLVLLAALNGLGLDAGELGLPQPLTEALITFAAMYLRGEPSPRTSGGGSDG